MAFWQLHLTFLGALVPLAYPSLSRFATAALSWTVVVLNSSSLLMVIITGLFEAREKIGDTVGATAGT
jgi:hypothetical protein